MSDHLIGSSSSLSTSSSYSNIASFEYWKSLSTFDNMVTTPSRPAPFGATTIMMMLFFGTNLCLFAFFSLIKYIQQQQQQQQSQPRQSSEVVTDGKIKKEKEKELSKPFKGSLDCFANLTTEFARLSCILAMTYICEYCWLFPHSTKSYSRDLFVFVLILFFAYAIYTIKPVHDLSLLGREQTEEWKGWMQFIFLLYHYFHAEEVYNSVRVMITCYVWMTGFGNFSFFYTKQDFSWLRIVQMLWRLNFSVLLLMWTHGNTYILYYICPMHTFYFLMVYVTMYLFSSINNTKWGIRFKLLFLAIIIYVIWDINGGLFDFLFAWLGTEKVIGASSGSVWEWYFRTSLDHWSTFLGMIFALNYPLAEQYFKIAKGPSLTIGAVLMGSLFLWWCWNYYPLDKINYNLTHSYMAIIPLTAYIFFRNITPSIRSGVSMSLHDLGKTTLETYLLQHHIWLSSNAKTLWTITPGNPWVNFALATLVFFAVSKELYRLTMSLRGMILPDDKNLAMKNGLGLAGLMVLCWGLAEVLILLEMGMLEVVLTCFGLAVVSLFVIIRFATSAAEQSLYQQYQLRFIKLMGAGFAIVLVFLLLRGNNSTDESPYLSNSLPTTNAKKANVGPSHDCLDAISNGHWAVGPCGESSGEKQVAYCVKEQWIWDSAVIGPSCPIHRYTPISLQTSFKNKRVAFIGDSIVRSAYHGFLSSVDHTYDQNHSYIFKHQDMNYYPSFSNTTSFKFYWTPFLQNITSLLQRESKTLQEADIIVMGASLWDALYYHNVGQFSQSLNELSTLLSKFSNNNNNSSSGSVKPVKMWLLPTVILDDRLLSEEKRQFMNEQMLTQYRQAVRNSAIRNHVQVIINGQTASAVRESHSVDGIHYTEDVYEVMGQMIANAFILHHPELMQKSASSLSSSSSVKKPYAPRPTGSMSLPDYGAAMLVLTVIMLFLMDSYLGIGYLSLLLGGKSYDWDAAYTPLHIKLGIIATAPPRPPRESEKLDADTDALLAEERGTHEDRNLQNA